jgi:hypothetical protein
LKIYNLATLLPTCKEFHRWVVYNQRRGNAFGELESTSAKKSLFKENVLSLDKAETFCCREKSLLANPVKVPPTKKCLEEMLNCHSFGDI